MEGYGRISQIRLTGGPPTSLCGKGAYLGRREGLQALALLVGDAVGLLRLHADFVPLGALRLRQKVLAALQLQVLLFWHSQPQMRHMEQH